MLSLVKNAPRNGFILDAGCGDLQYKNFIKDVSRKIVCLDIVAPQKNRSHEYMFSLGSIEMLPFKNNTFDFIFCFSVIQFIKDDRSVIDEFNRVLKPGGKLLVTVPTRISPFRVIRDIEILCGVYRWPQFNVDHHHYYSVNDIKDLVGNKFQIENITGYNYNFIPRFLNLLVSILKFKSKGEKPSPKKNLGIYSIINDLIKCSFNLNWANILCEISYHFVILFKKVEP